MRKNSLTQLASALCGLAFLATTSAWAQKNVLQPGDPIIASSANSPGSEGVANAIDGQPTKYLNFDQNAAGKTAGFVVSPSVGVTRVVGISLQSANDASDRDPKNIRIEGSNDATVSGFNSGTWDLITEVSDIPSWPSVFGPTDAENRFKTQSFFFDNFKAYKHYRFTVLDTQGPSTCCLQIAEVGLLGGLLPGDVTQPGDPIIASSANSPGSEGVANAIDGQPTKYLNFDQNAAGKTAGFVVSPSLGRTLITGVTMQSANDASDRDPKNVRIEGSNDSVISGFNSGNWEVVKEITDIPSWPSVFGPTDAENRFKTQTFLFDNYKPYRHYRFTVLDTQGPSTCCLQIAEVELLGTGQPKDVTQPGDPIIASSANSPGSEGVANAIDGQPTKYLNFDQNAAGKTAGFVVTPSIGATTIIGTTMQSANDASDRDPKNVKIEGSNDSTVTDFASGNWEVITTISDIPSWPSVFGPTDAENRFKTQEFYFANKKSYKHYRFTVLDTQGPSTCCLQIAEVELLAVTEQADCSKARFLTQPVNTPVLSGSSATFSVALNGPWPLQWFKNNKSIPGATSLSYTTEPITAANQTNVYFAQIVGCEASTSVSASVFTPSTVKSIGLNFIGGGANGAPTSLDTNDIAGLVPQAFWNNLSGGTATAGSVDPGTVDPETGASLNLKDSDNNDSTVTVEWTTSGTWGAGTGNASPTQRLLNGVVYANSGTPATIVYGNVPAGKHSVIVYLVGIPKQFQNADYKISGVSDETRYVRVINSDEYNAAPGFFSGTSTDSANRSLATYIRFDNVEATNGTITLTWDTKTSGFDRGTPVNGIQLVLNATPAGAPPVIAVQPQPTVGVTNGTVKLTVSATGDNLTYQWRKNGKNLPNGGNISGATTATLSIASFSSADEAVYSVSVFNAAGSAISGNASVRVSAFNILDRLTGYWKFDSTTGTVVTNSVAGGTDGTLTGTELWEAGKVLNALTFDGLSNFVVVSNYVQGTRQLGGSVWVKATVDTNDPTALTDLVLARNAQGGLAVGGDNVGQFELSLIANKTDGTYTASAAIGTGPNITRAVSSTPFTMAAWQHVAFSADGAQLRLYINGVEVAATDYSDALNPPAVHYLSFGARLVPNVDTGDLEADTTPNFLTGSLDELAVWTRGLSGDEVAKLYAAGNGGKALTTVVITPPTEVVAPTITVSKTGNNLTIAWTPVAGKLQSTPELKGAATVWTDVGSVSPATVPISSTSLFLRILVP